MSTDRWNRLSEWHNRWLKGDPAERGRLRDEFTVTSPDLVAEADALADASLSINGFLETPAFVLTAARLVSDEAAIKPGTLVGPYRIDALIARGGVGIVYRATDTRLNRQVALKTLSSLGVPEELRIERFLREARITASLDHPNVVKVFDVGTHEGQPFMVVELLEGETLREALERGSMAEFDLRRIGAEIARGLVAAHAAGLVHRDLKPENVFLTRAGATKILDFGIAKLAPEGIPRDSATLTGIVLGTAGYLAPEQIKGRDVDGRADLFALGAILFEMVTGQRAFAGETTVDTLHAIVHASPPDLMRERTDLSPAIVAVVSRLLHKAPEDRFQTAADLVWALEHHPLYAEHVHERVAPPARAAMFPMRVRTWMAALAATLTVGLITSAWLGTRGAAAARDTDVAPFVGTWTLPAGTRLWSAPVVSPDGRRVVWAGGSEAGSSQLYVRELSSRETRALSGTTAARQPFWSPDGQWIGFFARRKLQKIAALGGPVTDIADAPDARGGAWSSMGVIVFQPNYRDSPLLRVSDRGGRTQPVTKIDFALDDVSHRWPSFLPDGRHFLYLTVSVNDGRRGVYIGSLDETTERPRPIFLSDSGAIYAPGASRSDGSILSANDGRIEVRPFDATRLVVTGDARALEMNATAATPHHPSLLSASASVLAYASGGIPWGSRSGRVFRDGTNRQLESGSGLIGSPRVSADGRFLARSRLDAVRANPDIWVDDLQRGSKVRLTTSADFDVMPVWSPDGSHVAYRSGTFDEPTIAFAASDGSGVRKTMVCPQVPCEPSDWSPEGFLLLTVGRKDVWMMPVGSDGQAQPLLAEPFTERDARISPSARRWLAYVSDETGRPEVYVRSLSGPTVRYSVSTAGGDQPVWRRDGAELFFAGPEGSLYSVAVRPGPNAGLALGIPTKLNVPALGERHQDTIYDASPDGRTIYLQFPTDQTAPPEFGLVLGWRTLIK
jgi:eukaryotic-like serine/threonine-protein kinase